MSSEYERLGVVPGINARGWSSRLGQSRLSDRVIAAMSEAAQNFAPMAELQRAASSIIARVTGAESGCVASGDAACLSLAIAACIARDNVAEMDRIPAGPFERDEVVMHRTHRNPYDRVVRSVGARIVEFGYPTGMADSPFPWEFEAVISSRTAAILYVPTEGARALPLEEVVRIAQRFDIPVVVDAAGTVPPPANLRDFFTAGADLVSFSGGKGIEGPSGAGFLAGCASLIRSASVQQQDLHVRTETWTGPFGDDIEPGKLPLQGVGRASKVGREELVGLVVALEQYAERDHAAQMQAWEIVTATILADLRAEPLESVQVRERERVSGGVPTLLLDFGGRAGRNRALACVEYLSKNDPRVFVHERFVDRGEVFINPVCLAENEVKPLVRAVREAASSVVQRVQLN